MEQRVHAEPDIQLVSDPLSVFPFPIGGGEQTRRRLGNLEQSQPSGRVQSLVTKPVCANREPWRGTNVRGEVGVFELVRRLELALADKSPDHRDASDRGGERERGGCTTGRKIGTGGSRVRGRG